MAPVKFFVPWLDFRTSQVAIYRLTIYDCDHLSGSEKWSPTKLFLWNVSRIAPGKIRKANYLLLVLVAWVRGAGPSIWHWRRQFQQAESWKEMCIWHRKLLEPPTRGPSEHYLFQIMKGGFASSEWRLSTEFTSNPLTGKYTTYKVEAVSSRPDHLVFFS